MRVVRRVLCPRQPKRDRPLTQTCVYYAGESLSGSTDKSPSVLVLSPELSEEHPAPPFYHPAVAHLAIRYVANQESGSAGHVVIEVVRLVPDSGNGTFSERLVKTCVSLLEGVHRVGYGFANGYRKRVDHDVSRVDSCYTKLIVQ